jgi:hypothetical protein
VVFLCTGALLALRVHAQAYEDRQKCLNLEGKLLAERPDEEEDEAADSEGDGECWFLRLELEQ